MSNKIIPILTQQEVWLRCYEAERQREYSGDIKSSARKADTALKEYQKRFGTNPVTRNFFG